LIEIKNIDHFGHAIEHSDVQRNMVGSGIAIARLIEERKDFRKNRTFGFSAKPDSRPDGSVDMMRWKCIIPGKEKTICEGASFPCTLEFDEDYPLVPPKAWMPSGFFHPNVSEAGRVCLSVLKEDVPAHLGSVAGWSPSITVRRILAAVQELLHTPNFGSVIGMRAYHVYATQGRAFYDSMTRAQAIKYSSSSSIGAGAGGGGGASAIRPGGAGPSAIRPGGAGAGAVVAPDPNMIPASATRGMLTPDQLLQIGQATLRTMQQRTAMMPPNMIPASAITTATTTAATSREMHEALLRMIAGGD